VKLSGQDAWQGETSKLIDLPVGSAEKTTFVMMKGKMQIRNS
jgi:hypothetical protein